MRSRRLPQEQGEARPHHFHRGAAASAAGKFPAGQQSRRAGPGKDSSRDWPEQKGDTGVVPKQQSEAKEAPAADERKT